jgi:hypothetical protein
MIQSGDSDWIINSHPACAEASAGRPLGIDSRLRSIAMGLQKMLVLTKESFLFGGLSPPNKKITSLRPRRLCGENSILDKNDLGSVLLTLNFLKFC